MAWRCPAAVRAAVWGCSGRGVPTAAIQAVRASCAAVPSIASRPATVDSIC